MSNRTDLGQPIWSHAIDPLYWNSSQRPELKFGSINVVVTVTGRLCGRSPMCLVYRHYQDTPVSCKHRIFFQVHPLGTDLVIRGLSYNAASQHGFRRLRYNSLLIGDTGLLLLLIGDTGLLLLLIGDTGLLLLIIGDPGLLLLLITINNNK
jgi:hypothetical protein